MLKRAFLIFVILATACFATWDYKPLPKKTTASVRAQVTAEYSNKCKQFCDVAYFGTIFASFRYFPMKELELSYQNLGFRIEYSHYSNGQYSDTYSSVYLQNSVLGARYKVAPIVNAFLDLDLPTDLFSERFNRLPNRFTRFFEQISPYAGAQVASKLKKGKILSRYGSEAGIGIGNLFGKGDISFYTKLAGEVAFASPIEDLLLDFPLGLSISTAINSLSSTNVIKLWTGAETNFSKVFSAAVKFILNLKTSDYQSDSYFGMLGVFLIEGTYNF